jgi:hypothetical protein
MAVDLISFVTRALSRMFQPLVEFAMGLLVGIST